MYSLLYYPAILAHETALVKGFFIDKNLPNNIKMYLHLNCFRV